MSEYRTAWIRLLGELVDFAGRRAALVLGLMLLAAGLEGSGLLLLAPLLQLVAESGGGGEGRAGASWAWLSGHDITIGLGGVLLAYLALVLAHAAVTWRRDIDSALLQQSFVDHLRLQLYGDIAKADWAFLARTHSAELSHALNADLGRVSHGLTAALQLLTTGVMATAYVAIAISLSPALTLLTLSLGCVLLLSLRRHHGEAHAGGARLTRVTQRLHGEVGEFLAGLRLIKSGNLEDVARQRYGERMADTRAESMDFVRRQARARNLLRVGAAFALCLLTWIALRGMAVPPARILVLVFIFSRLLPFLSTLQQAYERLIHALPAYSAFAEMRSRCREAAEPVMGGETPPFEREIRLDGLCYRPPGAAADTLREVTLSIACRQTVALIGPSGAGKSTLADIVSGLLSASSGTLSIDGIALADQRAWRRKVAYVSQDSFLLNASVRNNMLWMNPGASQAEIDLALEQAAAGFVCRLPEGLDTVLGERGVRLSGGERQRLAIARALLRRPALLILDEATSALDRENERRVQESISGLHGQLTILVIAHRIDTVCDADCIHVLKDGRVVESGLYEELLANNSGYLGGGAAISATGGAGHA